MLTLQVDNRRILVDVERGRTVRNWRPRRFGGGLGESRKDKLKKTDEREKAKEEEKKRDAEKLRTPYGGGGSSASSSSAPPPSSSYERPREDRRPVDSKYGGGGGSGEQYSQLFASLVMAVCVHGFLLVSMQTTCDVLMNASIHCVGT